MVAIRRLTRQINRLIKRLDLDDIPPAALLFLGGCLILAVIGFFSWRSDPRRKYQVKNCSKGVIS